VRKKEVHIDCLGPVRPDKAGGAVGIFHGTDSVIGDAGFLNPLRESGVTSFPGPLPFSFPAPHNKKTT
jgi:hypothetical protein